MKYLTPPLVIPAAIFIAVVVMAILRFHA